MSHPIKIHGAPCTVYQHASIRTSPKHRAFCQRDMRSTGLRILVRSVLANRKQHFAYISRLTFAQLHFRKEPTQLRVASFYSEKHNALPVLRNTVIACGIDSETARVTKGLRSLNDPSAHTFPLFETPKRTNVFDDECFGFHHFDSIKERPDELAARIARIHFSGNRKPLTRRPPENDARPLTICKGIDAVPDVALVHDSAVGTIGSP